MTSVDEKYFKSDFEGVTLYEKDDGEGYIIVSIQGSNSFGIIDRKTKKMLSVFRVKVLSLIHFMDRVRLIL